MSHVIVENGVTYTVTTVNGKTVYDPPLPKEIVKRNAKRLREMLQSRRAPRCMTDVEMFEGVGTLAKQYEGEDYYLDKITKNAIKHGYTPNAHDMYMGNLARFEGDPEAFISPAGGRNQLKKVLEKRGLPGDGAVKVKGKSQEEINKTKKKG